MTERRPYFAPSISRSKYSHLNDRKVLNNRFNAKGRCASIIFAYSNGPHNGHCSHLASRSRGIKS